MFGVPNHLNAGYTLLFIVKSLGVICSSCSPQPFHSVMRLFRVRVVNNNKCKDFLLIIRRESEAATRVHFVSYL